MDTQILVQLGSTEDAKIGMMDFGLSDDSFTLDGRLNEETHGSRYHYLHMAQNNFREYLQGDEVWRKKYFYVLRPLLAIHWIEKQVGPVPIEFQRLVEATVDSVLLRKAIDELVLDKMAGNELDKGPRIEIISEFIECGLARLESTRHDKKPQAPPVDELNSLFRTVLSEIWPNTGI